jgi:hypothetical protein
MSKLKKVGVLTLHYGFNEGAILQAYAVTRLIEKYVSHTKAEIIDQRYPKKLKVYGHAGEPRKKALRAAIEDWLPLSNDSFRSEDETEVLDYASLSYDVLVIGSDVVWDLKYVPYFRAILPQGIWPRQRDPFFPAFPNVYWPGSSVDIPKISYAASIGTLEWKTVPRLHRRRMRKRLMDFELLGVRDERTLAFLEWLSPELAKRASIVPDPTLGLDLLDNSRTEELKDELIAYGVDFSRPRCGIICGPHAPLEKATKGLRRKGYQIIGITTANQYSDVELFDKSFHPLDWAVLFRLMNICIVERMHGSIFCIKNKTPFVALDSYETEQFNDSKTSSLLRRFGLEDLCVSKTQATSNELLERVTELERDKIDWGRVNEVLNSCRREAERFFRKELQPIM